MKQPSHNTRIILIILAIIIIIILSISFVHVRLINIPSAQVDEIIVINGLTGNQFHVVDTDAIDKLVNQINSISPVVGTYTGGPGYHYLLVFHTSEGNELERITLTNEEAIVIKDLVCYTDVSAIINYLSILETSFSPNK